MVKRNACAFDSDGASALAAIVVPLAAGAGLRDFRGVAGPDRRARPGSGPAPASGRVPADELAFAPAFGLEFELGFGSDFARKRCGVALAPVRFGAVGRDLAGLRVTCRPLIDLGRGGLLVWLTLTRPSATRNCRPRLECLHDHPRFDPDQTTKRDQAARSSRLLEANLALERVMSLNPLLPVNRGRLPGLRDFTSFATLQQVIVRVFDGSLRNLRNAVG